MSQDELQKLINLISRLPGIGQRSAQRIALYLIKNKQELMLPLGDSVKETAAVIKKCDNCGILDVIIPCKICSSDNRSKKTICIVEDMADVWYNIGHVGISLGDHGLAYQAYKISVSLNPAHAEAMNNLAVLEIRRKKIDRRLILEG